MKLSKLPKGSGMTRVRAVIIVLVVLVVASLSAVAIDKAAAMKQKVTKVVTGIEVWSSAVPNAEEPMKLLQQAKAEFDNHRAEQGEALLDRAMAILGSATEEKTAPERLLPQVETKEPTSDLYVKPEKVQIDGYSDDCMEPLISLDGRYLFWNNSNAENVKTHIHFARRTGERQFKYLGLLPGAAASGRDMAPTIDLNGYIYFTADRTYPADYNSLYCGKFANESLTNVHLVTGTISPHNPGWINMDCGISPDGGTLIISRTHFDVSRPGFPIKSDLLLARRGANGEFTLDPQSDTILRKLNTAALEYAPTITNDKLELYFTRASTLLVAQHSQGSPVRVMVARRKTASEPFGEPMVLSAIQGFVEAPTLSLDKNELFFHKKDGDKFCIYRVVRK